MLGDMLGVAETSRNSLVRVWQVLGGLPAASAATLALSAAVTAAILLGKRFAPRWPVPLAAIIAAIAASQAYHFAAHGIAIIGPLAGGLPAIRLPDVTWNEILGLAAGGGLVLRDHHGAKRRDLAQLRDALRRARRHQCGHPRARGRQRRRRRERHVPGQRQSDPDRGGGARRARAARSRSWRCRPRRSWCWCWGAREIQYLPHCVLAAVVFTIAIGMIDVRTLRDMRRESPGEFYLALATGATVVAIGVEQGILLAIALSLFRHVRHSYRPHTLMYKPDATGRWIPGPVTPGAVTEPGLIVYRFGADLFYANQLRFCDEVRTLVAHAPAPLRYFVVDASAITDIDYSAARSVRALIEDLQRERRASDLRAGERVSARGHGQAPHHRGDRRAKCVSRRCTKRCNSRAPRSRPRRLNSPGAVPGDGARRRPPRFQRCPRRRTWCRWAW